MHNIALLGATGSIGKSTLAVIRQYPGEFRLHSIAAGSNIEALVAIALEFRPERVVVADESKYNELKTTLLSRGLGGIKVAAGDQAVFDLGRDPVADTVVHAIVGAAGLAPAFAAAQGGKRLLLANKESVVCGGELLMRAVKRFKATMLPIDSEHNAIFQCLQGASDYDRENVRLWLTCSGGPFHAKKSLDLSTVTAAQALMHPTWSMGRKITIDSATLMNKGFEVIEAHHLFSVSPQRIRVVIHPQSVVHSMVEYLDGSVLAQMGPTDMRLAIAYCLGYPNRTSGLSERLDFTKLGLLSFMAPDTNRFPLLAYAYEALSEKPGTPIVLNAANEIAVEAFLANKIGFMDIAKLCRKMLDTVDFKSPDDLASIQAIDAEVRAKTKEALEAGLY